MREPWMIDELDHAGHEHLDPAFVAGYDDKQGHPDASADIARLQELGIGPSSAVVDFGAGTGQFALPAARSFGRLVAVEVSPAMISVLRRRAVEDDVSNLEVVEAGFLTYRHHGSPFDAAHTRNALHQLPDFFKALALHRISAVLRPGGILLLRDLIYDFKPSQTVDVFESWFAQAAVDPSHGYTRDDFAEHIRTEHSTFRWLLEPMLEKAGLEVLHTEFDRSVYGSYTCRKLTGM